MNTLKIGRKCDFSMVTSQKHCKLIYMNDDQKHSDNKYLSKINNIIKGLSGTLNCNK